MTNFYDKSTGACMHSHLRSGITPALFELDVLRYENLCKPVKPRIVVLDKQKQPSTLGTIMRGLFSAFALKTSKANKRQHSVEPYTI